MKTKVLVGFLLIVIIVLIGAGGYFLGRNNNDDAKWVDEYNFDEIDDGEMDRYEQNKRALDDLNIEINEDGGMLILKAKEKETAEEEVVDENMADGYNAPEHISYIFENRQYPSALQPWIELDIYKLPGGVQSFLDRNKDKNWAYIKSLSNVQKLLSGKESLSIIQNGNYLIFPPENVACTGVRSVKFLENEYMKGVRYITHCHQDYSPASDVYYVFQGISKDNSKHLVFSYSGILSKSLEEDYKNNPDAKSAISESDIKKTYDILDNERDDNFLPPLSLIDSFLESIKY